MSFRDHWGALFPSIRIDKERFLPFSPTIVKPYHQLNDKVIKPYRQLNDKVIKPYRQLNDKVKWTYWIGSLGSGARGFL
jgi:hypothetical protein